MLGGIHFESGDVNGRALGQQVATYVYSKALSYINGTVAGSENGSTILRAQSDLGAASSSTKATMSPTACCMPRLRARDRPGASSRR